MAVDKEARGYREYTQTDRPITINTLVQNMTVPFLELEFCVVMRCYI